MLLLSIRFARLGRRLKASREFPQKTFRELFRTGAISSSRRFPVLARLGSISPDIAFTGRRWRRRKQRRWPAAFVIRWVARYNVSHPCGCTIIQGWRILIELHDRSVKAPPCDNVTSISANKDRPRIVRATINVPMGFLWLKTSVAARGTAREVIRYYRGQIDCRPALFLLRPTVAVTSKVTNLFRVRNSISYQISEKV